MNVFLHSIQGRELETALIMTRNDSTMKANFVEASAYILNFICNEGKTKKKAHKIGAVKQQHSNGHRGAKGGRGAGHGTGKRKSLGDWSEKGVLAVIDHVQNTYKLGLP